MSDNPNWVKLPSCSRIIGREWLMVSNAKLIMFQILWLTSTSICCVGSRHRFLQERGVSFDIYSTWPNPLFLYPFSLYCPYQHSQRSALTIAWPNPQYKSCYPLLLLDGPAIPTRSPFASVLDSRFRYLYFKYIA